MSVLSMIRQFTLEPVILSLDSVFTLALHKTTMVKAALAAIALLSGIMLYFFLRAASGTKGKKKKEFLKYLPLLMIILFLWAARLFFESLQPLKGSKFLMLRNLLAPNPWFAVGTAAITFLSTFLLVSSEKKHRLIIGVGSAVFCGFVLFSAPCGMSLFWLGANAVALLIMLVFRKKNRQLQREEKRESKTERNTFLASCALLTVLVGLYLPGKVILSSPLDFIDISNYHSPFWYLLSSTLLAAGFFLVWIPACYGMAKPKYRRMISCASACAAFIAAVNGFFFGRGYGTMSSVLKYEQNVSNPLYLSLLNAALCIAVAAVVILVWRKNTSLMQAAALELGLAILAMSIYNLYMTQSTIKDTMKEMDIDQLTETAELPLSKDEKNVVVIMMDRAFNSYFPFIIEEKPELKKQFAGFTYYPNTISYSHFTAWGVPPLYGGYEYTPENINKRDDVLLVDKHNEALCVMPVIFRNAGWDVTVCDPSFAGYSSIPDLSIYDDYPEIKTYITQGNMKPSLPGIHEREEETRERNFFCYGVMRAAPVWLHSVLYSSGRYNESKADYYVSNQYITDVSTARGLNPEFLYTYEVLRRLPKITTVNERHKGSFIMLANKTTHNAALTREPSYEPSFLVDNTAYDRIHEVRRDAEGRELRLDTTEAMTHYHANMASMIKLGQWFDSLRERGVYDNTRIIIVADHGWDIDGFGLEFADRDIGLNNAGNISAYHPLLLVKDFDSTELTTDTRFMTNADTPTLAFAGLIEDPVNPFTGNKIDSHEKEESTEQHIAATRYFNVEQHRNDTTYPDVTWISMKNDVFKVEDWHFMDGEGEQ